LVTETGRHKRSSQGAHTAERGRYPRSFHASPSRLLSNHTARPRAASERLSTEKS
jgi:hypothetical protein